MWKMRRYSSRIISTQSLPFSKAKVPGRNDDQDEVEHKERKQHKSISPSILIPNIQRQEEVVSNGVRAISTSGGIVRVIEVSTKGRDELVRPSAACLTLRWIEHGEFLRLALDLESVKFGGDHRTHDPSQGIELVQPCSCPASDVGVWNRNTAEGRKDGHDKRVE